MNKKNSLDNGISLDHLKSNMRNSLIFHIPHSSVDIPDEKGFNKALLTDELNLLTDQATDEIFDIANTTKVLFPYSRLFCDVERLPDIDEPMFQKGRGFYYTHTDAGEILREENPELKDYIFEKFYTKHHQKLKESVESKLEDCGFATIIDCHSFSELPLKTEERQDLDRPDICLGTDSFHTPAFLYESLQKFFESRGYSVAINHPYAGTIVPLQYYKENKKVFSVMIEINKRVYMKEGEIMPEKVMILNKLISLYFTELLFNI